MAGVPSDVSAARSSLAGAGFQLGQSSGRYEVWTKPQAPGYVQALPERQMLVVGDRLNPLLGAFPFAEEADRTSLAALPAEDFDKHPVLGLYRFEAAGALPQGDIDRLTRFLEAGGTVVTDLSGMEDQFGKTLDFFGVTVVKLNLTGTMNLSWQAEAAGLPEGLPIADLAPEGWSGAAYQGLNGVLGSVTYEGRSFDVLGYRDVGRGRIWFVGLNLLYYAQETTNQALVDRIRGIVLQGVDLDTSVSYPKIPITGWQTGGTGLRFDYDLPTDVGSALVSFTYSPRFRAAIDGQPVSLVALSTPDAAQPAGWPTHCDHHLSSLWNRVALAGPGGTGDGYFGHCRGRAVGATDLSAADACSGRGRRGAAGIRTVLELWVPAGRDWSADGGDLSLPGRPIVRSAACRWTMRASSQAMRWTKRLRKQRLTDWLIENNHDPSTVHERWGFARDKFFEAEAGDGSPPAADVQEDQGKSCEPKDPDLR